MGKIIERVRQRETDCRGRRLANGIDECVWKEREQEWQKLLARVRSEEEPSRIVYLPTEPTRESTLGWHLRWLLVFAVGIPAAWLLSGMF